MSKIGVLYICTGDYVTFWPDFYLSAEQYFLKEHEIHYFVFTDAQNIPHQNDNDRIHLIPQKPLDWPFSTMMRFSMFLGVQDQLKECNYVFFFNANARFVKSISSEQFLPRTERGENLLVVQHPGFVNKEIYEFTYDRNPKCSAFIPYWKGDVYICGGINGGTTPVFLSMCEELSKRINKDLEKGIIPEWHDESHINKYILDRQDIKVLSPAYCYPEGWNIPYDCIILIRDKKKYINITEIRKNAPETVLSKSTRFLNRIIKKIVMVIMSIKR